MYSMCCGVSSFLSPSCARAAATSAIPATATAATTKRPCLIGVNPFLLDESSESSLARHVLQGEVRRGERVGRAEDGDPLHVAVGLVHERAVRLLPRREGGEEVLRPCLLAGRGLDLVLAERREGLREGEVVVVEADLRRLRVLGADAEAVVLVERVVRLDPLEGGLDPRV